MNTLEVADRVEEFVRTQFKIAPGDVRFSRSAPLFDAGYVDSVGVVELLSFLAREFAVELPDDALISDDFSTINGIAQIVCRHRTARSG